MSHDNKAILIGHYGGDQTHAVAAWSSTFLDLEIEMPEDVNMRVGAIIDHIINNSTRIRDVKGLLTYLADEKHASPFRFSTLHFVTTTDISVHIQFLKHAVAMQAENAESARYKELKEDKFYLPEDWLEYGEVGQRWYSILKNATETQNSLYHQCVKELVEAGAPKSRVKESARFFKTYNSQLNSNKLFSFDGFLQVYFKRNLTTPSQLEIGEVVEQMLEQIKAIPGNPFKDSLEAFGLN